ncbi:alkaline phosphatase D family protein [Spongiibacter sp. UBA1325]|uniref:alkaline phosphatase D family protein n=1 Tax=Spongiibacter sp. UBA1325 TaxID=1947543 RepID=UPI00257CBF49|nr:alkaline phosphatase D family protein [Spongiibacter sp. UBA1325]
MDRRLFIKALTTASIGIPILTACGGGSNNSGGGGGTGGGVTPSAGLRFEHGVASGDPLDDRVILWTRATPALGHTGDITVLCEIAEDPSFERIVLSETLSSNANRDYTVKFDAAGLLADRRYWYRFKGADSSSPVGRARTLPLPGQYTDRLRFAVCSCSSYPHGYFSVYRMMANRADLDFVMHLGDYIYEYGQDEYGDHPERLLDPAHEIVSLDDYRRRYALYRRDVDLQATHATHSFVTVWDDHETTDNSYKDGANNHNEGEGDWFERKRLAIQAYFEWLPIRPPTASQDSIYRAFRFGDLADFVMLDTRLEGREKQLDNPVDPARIEQRDLLGQTQKDWFKNQLAVSQGIWKFVGQQVMFAQLQILELQRLLPGVPTNDFSPLIAVNMDQWDGYPTEREEILDFIDEQGIQNTVILTGDIHTSWANEVYKSSAILTSGVLDEPLAVEFVTSSITSPGFPDGAAELVSAVLPVANPHMKYTDLKNKGFILMDVTRERTQAEYYYAADISRADQSGVEMDKVKTLSVNAGSSRLVEDTPVSRPRS